MVENNDLKKNIRFVGSIDTVEYNAINRSSHFYNIDGAIQKKIIRMVHILNWRKQHGSVGNTTSEAGKETLFLLSY